jgi:hypothetical protein
MLLLINIAFGADKVLTSCFNAKVELYDLATKSSKGYQKDSMTIDIIERSDKYFVKSNTSESELIYIGGNQFIEEVSSGHSVLYTYFQNRNILTIQKSYEMFGPIMLNTYLECK